MADVAATEVADAITTAKKGRAGPWGRTGLAAGPQGQPKRMASDNADIGVDPSDIADAGGPEHT